VQRDHRDVVADGDAARRHGVVQRRGHGDARWPRCSRWRR
jgi:hypothetical protein